MSKKLCRAAVFLLLAVPAGARAQTQAPPQPQSQSLAFESISIKPAQSEDRRNMRVRVMPNGDFSASSVHVFFLLRYAYDVSDSQRLSMLPTWREIHDIEAKAPANAFPPGLSERERWNRMQQMLRAMLADRFKLGMRIEQKTMPVYVLTVASGGPAFKKSPIAEKDCLLDTTIADSCHNFAAGRGHPLIAKAITMDDLVQHIENWTDLPVVNRTALSGLFAIEGEGWKPMRLPPRPPEFPQVPNFDDLPSIFTVLGKLGLELKQQEATVPVYTMTHIERPPV
jgi:uncharacterized protein (TIGR03435 family)